MRLSVILSVPLRSEGSGVLLSMISKSSFGDSGFLVAFIFHVTNFLESCWILTKKLNDFLKDNVIGT